MGCCTSSQGFNANVTLDGFYAGPQRGAFKRSYSSRDSNTSSGVFSRCTTPNSRHSLQSRCSSSTSSSKTTLCSNKKVTIANGCKVLSIIDDFAEMEQQNQEEMDKSCGYFTKSISSSSSGSKTSLRYTRDTSFEYAADSGSGNSKTQSFERPDTPSGCELEMEMYMMTTAKGIMGKTSSPMLQRRESLGNATYNIEAAPARHSASYNKWCNFLQSTPTYIVNNVTNIPEAVAGHFCPSDFPGFIDVEIEGNAAKRFKLDTAMEVEAVVHAEPRPYISTEL